MKCQSSTGASLTVPGFSSTCNELQHVSKEVAITGKIVENLKTDDENDVNFTLSKVEIQTVADMPHLFSNNSFLRISNHSIQTM